MPAPLIYANTASLDGYIAGPDGRWEWGFPDDQVHRFFNDLMAPVRTYLYGRKVHEVMTFWDDADLDEMPETERQWAVDYRATQKIVYSRTLTAVSGPNTTLRSTFDADEVRALKQASDTPIGIGGGHLASEAARAGVLDEVHMVVAPAVVGGGTRFLDEGLDLRLTLRTSRQFASGFVHLGYDVVR